MDDAQRRRRRDDEEPKRARASERRSGKPPRRRTQPREATGRPDRRGSGTGDRASTRGARASGAPKTRTGGASRGRPTARSGSERKPREGGPGERRSSGRPERGRYEQPRTKRKGGPSGRGRPERGTHKRTSRSSDERNPTRSGIDYPSPKYRTKGEPAPTKPARPALRTVRGKRAEPKQPRSPRPRKGKSAPRRRPVRATEATEELRQLAGRGANRAVAELARAAEAAAAGHDRDALRILRPLRDQYPDAAAVRELIGLCHYRIAQYPAAEKELRAFVELSGSVEQHPVLMDCARAQRKWARVNELWDELAAASPSAALVAEGRIVMAGSLADRGRLRDAIALLERRADGVRRPAEHHLRVWYALADMHERAGDLPRARELFDRVRRADPSFADVAERLLALG